MSKSTLFSQLCMEAQACRDLPDLADKAAVLSDLNGSLSPKVFFGEAPGESATERGGRFMATNRAIICKSCWIRSDFERRHFYYECGFCSPLVNCKSKTYSLGDQKLFKLFETDFGTD